MHYGSLRPGPSGHRCVKLVHERLSDMLTPPHAARYGEFGLSRSIDRSCSIGIVYSSYVESSAEPRHVAHVSSWRRPYSRLRRSLTSKRNAVICLLDSANVTDAVASSLSTRFAVVGSLLPIYGGAMLLTNGRQPGRHSLIIRWHEQTSRVDGELKSWTGRSAFISEVG